MNIKTWKRRVIRLFLTVFIMVNVVALVGYGVMMQMERERFDQRLKQKKDGEVFRLSDMVKVDWDKAYFPEMRYANEKRIGAELGLDMGKFEFSLPSDYQMIVVFEKDGVCVQVAEYPARFAFRPIDAYITRTRDEIICHKSDKVTDFILKHPQKWKSE